MTRWNASAAAVVVVVASIHCARIVGVVPSSSAHAAVIAHWRFENGAANTAASGSNSILDSSGNGRHGTPVNGPFYRSDVPAPVLPTGVANARSLDFGGDTDHERVFIADDPSFQLQSLTLEAFVKVHNAGGQRQIVFRGDDRFATDPYYLALRNGAFTFHIEDAQQLASEVQAAVPALNQWVHVAGTFDAATGRQRLYVNGTEMTSALTAVRPFLALDSASLPGLGIGNVQSQNYLQYFDGLIDEVRISDRALLPSELLVPEPSSALAAAALAAAAGASSRGRRRRR